MAYEMKVDDRGGIVEIRFWGADSHAEHVKVRNTLLETCRERGIRKILVDARDVTTKNGPTTMELFDFGATWSDLTRDTPVLLAGILPRDEASQRHLMFGDTVAYNRGFVTRAFEDIEEARTWLRSTQR